jgi:MipA family protein
MKDGEKKYSIALSTLLLFGFVITNQGTCLAQASPMQASSPSAATTPNSSANNNTASDWRFSVGAGVIFTPRFIGATKRRIMAIPSFDVRYQDWFFANPFNGVGVETKPLEGLSLTASLGVDLTSRDSSADPRLDGLTKISAAPALKFGSKYEINNFTFSGALSQRLGASERGGATARFEAGYNAIATRQLLLSVGVFQRVIDKKYARNFLSITPLQASITKLREYEAKRGLLDGGLYAQGLYRIDDRWLIFSRLEVAQLANNAADSPIVQSKNHVSALVFLNRSF